MNDCHKSYKDVNAVDDQYDIDDCVWCGKGEDTKNPNRQKERLLRIEQTSSWNTFKRHPVYLEDDLRE